MPWTKILYSGQCETWLKDVNTNNILHVYGKPPNKFIRKLESLNEIIRLNTPVIDFIRKLYLSPFYSYLQKNQPTFESGKLKFTEMSSLKINIIDVNPFVIFKFLMTMKWFVNYTNYDYVYCTTTSSYLRINKLIEYVNRINKNIDCCGTILNHNEIKFLSGANRLFSRKAAIEILENIDKIDLFIPEDAAIGKLLISLGYPLTNLPTLNISSEEEMQKLTDNEIKENFHFRLKSTGPISPFNIVNATYHEKVNRNDVKLMVILHQRLSNQKV
jgi:hypothetical protein